jgi:hypothetical protein
MEPLDLSAIGTSAAPAAPPSLLSPQAFFLGCENIFAHLRLKESDRWGEALALAKLASFTASFPEVNDRQFLWVCEEWVQQAYFSKGFRTFPTWAELASPLYRREHGLANRSWGFNPNLPPQLQPTAQQLLMLPGSRQSLLPPAEPGHEPYVPPATHSQWTAVNGSAMESLPPERLLPGGQSTTEKP